MEEIGSEMSDAHNENPISICFCKPITKMKTVG